jgi:hypothetical protein
MVRKARAAWGIAAALTLLCGAQCGFNLGNQTASLGGSTAGGRGIVRVVFINKTSHRAAFTFGTYDQTDPETRPDFDQFGPEPEGQGLDGASASDIVTLSCARVFSIGGPALLALIDENLPDAVTVDEALVEGIAFFHVDADDNEPTLAGTAPPFAALLGIDFPCNALLIIRFELDDVGPDPFRVDFEIIPSESDR